MLQLSLKLFNVTPGQLPELVRQDIMGLVATDPVRRGLPLPLFTASLVLLPCVPVSYSVRTLLLSICATGGNTLGHVKSALLPHVLLCCDALPAGVCGPFCAPGVHPLHS